ncbi:MAG: twin-arginine translocase subunit TatB [Thermodesulfobacteriales bacterium]|jgi:sec-independent protein translocase protein TatB|nr:MAG: twin-arginine translocase subunit TatB [Thermodesulfobacteriales bacterium]
MFGIGTTEILIVLVIALLLLGPKEIPKIARTIGRGMRELERAKDELKKTIEFEAERDNPDSPENAEDEDPVDKDQVDKDSNKPEDLGNIPTTRI